MKSTRVYAIVILALALITTGVVAWQQHVELLGLRQPAKTGKDTAALEKRAWDAEQKIRELEAELANAKTEAEAMAARGRGGRGGPQVAADGTVVARGPGGPGGPFGGRGGNPQQVLQQLMSRPEYQQAQAIQQRAQLDVQYAGLIRNLGLSGDQAEKLKSVILERNVATEDAMTAARAAGLDPRTDEYQQFLNQSLSAYNDSLRGVLGDSGFATLQNYDATQSQRTVVNAFQQQLLQYGTSSLLTDAQSEQLTQLLANSGQARPAAARGDQVVAVAGRGGAEVQMFIGAAGLGGTTGLGTLGMQTISANVVAQAQQILTPVQYQALVQMQKAQQAQQTMTRLTTTAVQEQQQAQQQQRAAGGQQAAGGGRQRGGAGATRATGQ